MNLRLRLIVAFFLLSVVPLGAVTFYTYATNAAAMREAAGREAELLAGELTERMKLVTAQLSQRFERLIEVPRPEPQPRRAASGAVESDERQSGRGRAALSVAQSAMAAAAAAVADARVEGAKRLGAELGEVAMLLNNVEVRDFGRGRFGGRGGAPDSGRVGPGVPPVPGEARPPSPDLPPGPPPELPPPPPDPTRIQIDLGPLRREILREVFPERERWDQLSREERAVIFSRLNERMLGIRQGIEILQQKATEQAADAAMSAGRGAAAAAAEPAAVPAPPESPVAPPAAAAVPPPPPARTAVERRTAFSGRRMDVSVTRNGETVGQVNAEINLPNLLATVFTTTRRDRGEVPFAVDAKGGLYTPSEADRAVIAGLNTAAAKPETPPGTVLLPDWVIVTAADPTGSELKFGIARPVGDALQDLRRTSTRNAALGLALIGLALVGIVPLSGRLTRNLSRLSDGVNRIARGDYATRVDVSSKDEIGRLAGAFNRMAEDVERHQRAAVEQERLRRELELGRQIQHDMLPHDPLRLGLTEVRGVSVPATEVGGDFFNYFQTATGAIALVVGDVSGKGVGAALLMANIQASLRARLALGQPLASLARELDADIGASTPGASYATLFVALLDPEHRMLDYVNAGHHPQYVVRAAGGLERMESTGLPIGMLVGHDYGERRVHLAPGDALFFYTDGCVEAENGAGEPFGNERLEALLAARPRDAGSDILPVIEREIRQFRSGREPFDDATMMVVTVG
jgi:serine phosphatase RsbU (regulator of sigma subunit)